MKKFRNSFALLVALATIGITLMSHTSVFNRNVILEPTGCYKPDLTAKLACGYPDQVISTTSSCNYAKDFEIGAHIFDINPNDYMQLADAILECNGGNSFCCATVQSDQTWGGNLEGPCDDQPYFTLEGLYNQYEIKQVYCKNTL